MIAMNQELFQKYAVEGNVPVLVEYWAPWCVYCRRIGPALDKIAQQFEGSVIVGKINVDEEPLLASKERIEAIPTMILYQNGQVLDSIVAPESKARIEDFLRDNLGG